jgi:ribonuclease D
MLSGFKANMTVRLHRGDRPITRYGREVAIDTETMGPDPRDWLCVVQLARRR